MQTSKDLLNAFLSSLCRGLLLSMVLQQGHRDSMHTINRSHVWHRFWPEEYLPFPIPGYVPLIVWQISRQVIMYEEPLFL